jgi:RelB Antitoxin alpha helical domain
MFALRKNYVLDENQQPIAVQISIGDFQRLEEILEDYGLARLMDEVPPEDRERCPIAPSNQQSTIEINCYTGIGSGIRRQTDE